MRMRGRMKKTLVLFFCLAFLSLACVWTASPAGGYPTDTPVGFIRATQVIETQAADVCAVVIADEALHLRDAASENAGILTWLKHGDVVRVVDQINGDWWRVRSDVGEGYARAVYLQETRCVENGE